MSIATMTTPAATRTRTRPKHRPGRLLLVIGKRIYRFWPHVLDRGLESEERHVFRGTDRREFSVFEEDLDFDEARDLLINDRPIPRRFHCEACGVGDCEHVAALVELGLL